MEHHRLDPYPIPKERTPFYVNEPWLADKTLLELPPDRESDRKEDNVRIYIPMDLNREAILRRPDGLFISTEKPTKIMRWSLSQMWK